MVRWVFDWQFWLTARQQASWALRRPAQRLTHFCWDIKWKINEAEREREREMIAKQAKREWGWQISCGMLSWGAMGETAALRPLILHSDSVYNAGQISAGLTGLCNSISLSSPTRFLLPSILLCKTHTRTFKMKPNSDTFTHTHTHTHTHQSWCHQICSIHPHAHTYTNMQGFFICTNMLVHTHTHTLWFQVQTSPGGVPVSQAYCQCTRQRVCCVVNVRCPAVWASTHLAAKKSHLHTLNRIYKGSVKGSGGAEGRNRGRWSRDTRKWRRIWIRLAFLDFWLKNIYFVMFFNAPFHI